MMKKLLTGLLILGSFSSFASDNECIFTSKFIAMENVSEAAELPVIECSDGRVEIVAKDLWTSYRQLVTTVNKFQEFRLKKYIFLKQDCQLSASKKEVYIDSILVSQFLYDFELKDVEKVLQELELLGVCNLNL